MSTNSKLETDRLGLVENIDVVVKLFIVSSLKCTIKIKCYYVFIFSCVLDLNRHSESYSN